MTGSPQPPEPYSNEEIPRCAFGLEAGDAPTGREYDRLAASLRELSRLRDALRSIAKGEGRFNRDPLTHASNTIEDMIAIAEAALGDQPGGGSQ
jgi:hypothetical protein